MTKTPEGQPEFESPDVVDATVREALLRKKHDLVVLCLSTGQALQARRIPYDVRLHSEQRAGRVITRGWVLHETPAHWEVEPDGALVSIQHRQPASGLALTASGYLTTYRYSAPVAVYGRIVELSSDEQVRFPRRADRDRTPAGDDPERLAAIREDLGLEPQVPLYGYAVASYDNLARYVGYVTQLAEKHAISL